MVHDLVSCGVVARLFVLGLTLASACAPDIDYAQTKLEFEVVSPAVPGGGAQVYAAAGNIIFTATHISKDGGATWRENNAALIPTTALAPSEAQLVIATTQFGWGRWDMATDQVLSLSPQSAIGNTLHVRKNNLTILVNVNGQQTIARQLKGGHWGQQAVPNPPTVPATPFEVIAINSNQDVALAVTTWGVYRSTDDGITWTFLYTPSALIVSGLEPLVVLPDGRFLLFAANHTATVHDAQGMPTGVTTPAFPANKRVPCLGGIVAGDKFTKDLGQTFEPLVPGGSLRPITVSSYECNGNQLTMFISAPSPWLVQTTELGKLSSPMVFAFNPVMPQMFQGVQAKDGTTLAGNLGWKPGDATWSIRIAPDAQLYALADGSIFGFKGTTTYRSKDGGATWTSGTSATVPQLATRFMSDAQHVLWASSGGSSGSKIFRSDDDGATWSTVSDKPYPSPELVAIAADGTFVAKSFGSGLYVSHDRGATWTDLPFPTPYSLELVVGTDAVTWDTADDNQLAHTWHLWRDYGLGNAYREITPTMGGMPIELGTAGAKVTIADDGHAYLFGGGTLQGVFRSTEPF